MPKLPKKNMPIFSDGDVAKLLAVCDAHRDRAMIMLVLDTGIRAFEMVGLNVADVSMETGAVFVRLGKGQKDRTVYVSPRTLKQVMRYLAERESMYGSHVPALLGCEVTAQRHGRLPSSAARRLGGHANHETLYGSGRRGCCGSHP